MRRAGRAPAHRVRAAALLLIAGVVSAVLGTGNAQAAGYRYWSFWQGEGGTWTYATQGPSLVRPDDGAVQGFRFAVSEDSRHAARPRRVPDFGAICAGTPAKDGTKRVALVIDPGTAADAPAGESPPDLRAACARVAPDASAAQALASVAKPLRYSSDALLCAISGFPESGCGEQVSGSEAASGGTAGPAPAGTGPASGGGGSSSGGSSSGVSSSGGSGNGGGPSASVLVGVGAVLLLGIAAILQARRRR